MLKFIIFSLLAVSTLTAEIKVLVFAGSTREDSYNKQLIRNVGQIAAAEGAKVTTVDLKDYPMALYDADLEASKGMPSNARKLRQLMKENQVIFIASPQYNGSVPAVLKNALDWASRNEEGQHSRDAYHGKKFVLLSASPGKGGGARGLRHLRDIIHDAGGSVQIEEFSLSSCDSAFNELGRLKNPAHSAALREFVQKMLR
ncbi:putative protein YieF [Chlamydiales bacterium STE3]|nr:putative protein YieF [Chlamydiales bacterium STE3]